MVETILTEATFKNALLCLIVFISFILQCALIFSLIRKQKEIDFLSCIKRDNRISKAGLFFFVLMGIIAYQALFTENVDMKLVELMALIIGGDLGATWLSNNRHRDEMRRKRHEHEEDEET